MDAKIGRLLQKIDSPEDLRAEISLEELPELCSELRDFIIDIVSVHGGHLGSSLGVVELTVALHYVFDTPRDLILWDVGHQAYGHKILTGRRGEFHTNRKLHGISGFPKRSESVYDTFGTGHSSTSISAMLGMAVGDKLKADLVRQHVAVIGDGALTAGMAFEGLNHAGGIQADMLVILNDNCMSIDPNVGALKDFLNERSAILHPSAEAQTTPVGIKGQPAARSSVVKRVTNALVQGGAGNPDFFEALNFTYFGPVDGHDVAKLTEVLKEIKSITGPKILHCVTIKGKGYLPAESGSASKWHAPGLFNKTTGEPLGKVSSGPRPPKYQDVFGHTLLELARSNDKILGITPAMPTGSSLKIMMDAMPDRAFDVGIAEQHAVTFSAGLSTRGFIPFCVIYSTFMQRAYDQAIHDVALQNLNVVFCLDRAGFAGSDGATHQGAFDLAYFRCIPNITLCAPRNEQELRNLMFTAQQENMGPFVIRYPRGEGVMTAWRTPLKKIQVGTGVRLTRGGDVAIIALGHTVNFALEAAGLLKNEGIAVSVYDLRFVKPLDENLLVEVFSGFGKILTVEDGCLMGGMGSAVLEFMSDKGLRANVVRLGMSDRFYEHGTQEELYREAGFDTAAIVASIRGLV